MNLKTKPIVYSLFFCWLLFGCQPWENPSDTLVIALDSEPQTLDPRKAVDANGMRLMGLIFNGLVKIGPQLEAIPDGIKRWKREGLVYEFYLRKLRFSNSRFVLPEDVKFSFQEFMKEGSFFHSAFKNIESVKVSQEKKNLLVTIKLKKPSATFLSSDLPVIKILPKVESLKKDFYKNPIGTGDFKVIKKHSHEILLERRLFKPSYPKYLSFAIVRDSFTRVQKTLAGGVDIAPSVIPLEKISYFKNKDFYIETKPGLSVTYLLLNLKNKHLKKLHIRKALGLLVNQREVIQFKMQNYGLKAQSLLHPDSYFFNKALPPLTFDTQKSLQITKGINKKHLKFKLSCSNNKDTVDKAKILINQINKGDFHISLESYEWGTFYRDLQQGHFDIALMKWVGVVDPDIYRVAFHSGNKAPQGRNRSFYENPQLDRLLEQGISLTERKQRKVLYDKIQEIILKDLVILPLWHDKSVTIVKTGLKGYILPDNGDFSTLPLVKNTAQHNK